MKRQIFALGDRTSDPVASLGLDSDGLTCVCITAAGVDAGPQEIWIFGKSALRRLGELALAAQQVQEQEPENTPNFLQPPIDTDGEVGHN
jgi:hypothetical protein